MYSKKGSNSRLSWKKSPKLSTLLTYYVAIGSRKVDYVLWYIQVLNFTYRSDKFLCKSVKYTMFFVSELKKQLNGVGPFFHVYSIERPLNYHAIFKPIIQYILRVSENTVPLEHQYNCHMSLYSDFSESINPDRQTRNIASHVRTYSVCKILPSQLHSSFEAAWNSERMSLN